MNVLLNLSCGKCGGQKLTCADDPDRDTPVTCAACGDVATYGVLYDRLAKEVLENMEKGLGDMLGKRS